jgi:hypothetical protein
MNAPLVMHACLALIAAGTAVIGVSVSGAPAHEPQDAITAQAKAVFGLRAANVVALNVEYRDEDALTGRVPLDNAQHSLRLVRQSIRSADYQVLRQIEDGSCVPVVPQPVRTYRGEVADVEGSAVAASLLDDGLHALVVFPEGGRYWIEPIAARIPGALLDEHVVYRSEDVIGGHGVCGMLGQREAVAIDMPLPEGEGGVAGGSSCLVAELACDADYEYYQVSAHELGHLWGSDHSCAPYYTMWPDIQGSNVFHPICDIPEIAAYRDRGACFTPDPCDPFRFIDLHPYGWVAGSVATGITDSGPFGTQTVGYGDVDPYPNDEVHAVIFWANGQGTVEDLHPSQYGYQDSWAYGASGGRQVGVGVNPNNETRALMWSGSAASVVGPHPSIFADCMSSSAQAISGTQVVGYGDVDCSLNEVQHAVLWLDVAASPPNFAIDLHPVGFARSFAYDIEGGQQVGYGTVSGDIDRALLWSGSAASAVNLHPSGFTRSFALGVSDGQQVGFGYVTYPGPYHALMWSGDAASVVDLHPIGFANSYASAVSGGTQVGYAELPDGLRHAMLWSGDAASAVDLHQFLPQCYYRSEAWDISEDGTRIVGVALSPGRQVGCAWVVQPGCDVPGDVNGDGSVDVQDVVAVIVAWGPCPAPCPPRCPADLNGDCVLDVQNLIIVIVNWG